MARQYRQNIPTPWAEEHPLASHLTVHAQRAAEAVYEETRNDYCVVLTDPKSAVSADTAVGGLIPVLMRRDRRDGLYRSQRITPLVQTLGQVETLVFAMVDTTGRALTACPSVRWEDINVAYEWLDPQTVEMPVDWLPADYRSSDGDERQHTFIALGVFYWEAPVYLPYIAAYRVEELVEDSWL